MTDTRAADLIAKVRELDKAYWVARAEKAEADLVEARRMLEEARGELGAAINQSVATDDQIIMDHMRRAHQMLDEAIARHQAREGR